MEPHGDKTRKRKKKTNFLRKAKHYGKKGQYGKGNLLSQDDYNYYISIFEHLKQVKGEERELLVRNVLNELVEKEEVKKLASNQIVSRILDDALQHSEVPQVLALSRVFAEDLRTTCTDPYASHVLQTLMNLSLKFIQPNAVQKDTTAEDVAEDKEETIPIAEEQREEFSSFLNKVGRFVYNNIDEFIKDVYGSYVFRSVLEICSGVQLQDAIKRSTKSQTNHALCEDVGQIFRIPSELQGLLEDITQRVLTLPDLPGLITSESASASLQCTILVLKGTSNQHCSTLVRHIRKNGFPNLVSMLGDSKEGTTDLPQLFHCNPAVRLLEVMMSCATDKQRDKIFKHYFKGHMQDLVKHKSGNFAVQKLLLSWQEKETFFNPFEEVQESLPTALEVNNTGVIFALAQACRKLEKSQGQCWKAIMQLLRCYEPQERQSEAAACLLWFLNYDEYQQKRTAGNLPPVSLHGALILQEFLQYIRTIKVVNSVLSMSLADLQLMACDPRGSHVVDAFFSTPFIKINNKERLIDSYKGTYVALSCSKHGSRSLEAMWKLASIKLKTGICEELVNEELKVTGNRFGVYIFSSFKVGMFKRKDKQDWQQLVDRAEKKKRLLDELITDVAEDDNKKKKKKKKIST